MRAKGVIRKILGQSVKNGYLKIVQKGGPLGREGVGSLKRGGGEGVSPPFPPKSVTGCCIFRFYRLLKSLQAKKMKKIRC